MNTQTHKTEGEEFRWKKTGTGHVDDHAGSSAGIAWESTYQSQEYKLVRDPTEPQQRQEDQKSNLGFFWSFASSGPSFD